MVKKVSFQKLKSDSLCVGGKYRLATKNTYGDITSKGNEVLIGYCSICNRKKSMAVCDNTIYAEFVVAFSKIYVKYDSMYQKRWQKTL